MRSIPAHRTRTIAIWSVATLVLIAAACGGQPATRGTLADAPRATSTSDVPDVYELAPTGITFPVPDHYTPQRPTANRGPIINGTPAYYSQVFVQVDPPSSFVLAVHGHPDLAALAGRPGTQPSSLDVGVGRHAYENVTPGLGHRELGWIEADGRLVGVTSTVLDFDALAAIACTVRVD